MILLMRDAMVHPGQARAPFAIEPADALKHGELTCGANSSRTVSVGLLQPSKEIRLRPMPTSAWGVLLDEGGEALSREVSGRIRQLAGPHQGALDDVLDQLNTGAGARGRTEGQSRRRDVLDLRDDPLPRISPRVKGFFQQRW